VGWHPTPAAWFVIVPYQEPVNGTDAGSRPVEPEEWQAVLGWHQVVDAAHMLSVRRGDRLGLLSRQLH
jgi:hypothetical protein